MKLGVIIPCYNGGRTIATQLEALASQCWDEPWEVVVADNGSTDDSVAIIERYRDRLPGLRVVEARDRRGAPHALNVAARSSGAEALALCDADDEAGEGWVAAIGRALERHDFVASRFETRRLNPAWSARPHGQERGLSPYRDPPYLPHAGQCGLGIRRTLFESVGGFDESLLLLHETDLCWRLQLTGTELHFVPDAVMHIRFRSTLRGIYHQALGYAEYNVLLYKRYRAHGMPALARAHGIATWERALRSVLRARSKAKAATAAWELGWAVGRLRGSLKHRVFAL